MSTALKVVHSNAELVTVGKRALSTSGYRLDLVELHLLDHLKGLSDKWCNPGCMARTMFGRNTETGRKGIRKRIAKTFKVLLHRGMFLVIEYDVTPNGHGQIKAFKIFEDGAGAESQYALSQIERMTLRKQVTEEMREKALSVIGQK